MTDRPDPDRTDRPAPQGAGHATAGAGGRSRLQARELVIPAWVADILVCLALAGVGLWFVLQALPMPPGRTMIGVGTFPKIIGMLLIVLCLLQAAGSVIGRERGGSVTTGRPLMVGIAIVLVLLFPAAMDRFGYYLSAAIWVPAFAWIAGMREIGAFVVITATVLALARFVFQGLLGTPLS